MKEFYEVQSNGVTLTWVPINERAVAQKVFDDTKSNAFLFHVVGNEKRVIGSKVYVGK